MSNHLRVVRLVTAAVAAAGEEQPQDGQRQRQRSRSEECPPGTELRRVDGGRDGDGDGETGHFNEDRSTGEPEGEHSEDTSGDGDSGDDGFECVDTGKGKPKGGVEAGFGGGLVEAGFSGPQKGTLEEVNKAPSLLLLGGSTLLAVGLVGGGWLVFRRRT